MITEEIARQYRQHFEEGGHCDGACEVVGHEWVRDLLDRIDATRKLLTTWRYKTGPCPACHSTVHRGDCVLVGVMDALAGIEKPRSAREQ